MTKQVVHLEPLREALQIIAAFNRLDLKQVELRENGHPLAISDECVERFQVTGLSNKDFVNLEYWNAITTQLGH